MAFDWMQMRAVQDSAGIYQLPKQQLTPGGLRDSRVRCRNCHRHYFIQMSYAGSEQMDAENKPNTGQLLDAAAVR
jgi:hypothetical protein